MHHHTKHVKSVYRGLVIIFEPCKLRKLEKWVWVTRNKLNFEFWDRQVECNSLGVIKNSEGLGVVKARTDKPETESSPQTNLLRQRATCHLSAAAEPKRTLHNIALILLPQCARHHPQRSPVPYLQSHSQFLPAPLWTRAAVHRWPATNGINKISVNFYAVLIWI